MRPHSALNYETPEAFSKNVTTRSLLAGAEIRVTTHFVIVAFLLGAMLVVSYNSLPKGRSEAPSESRHYFLPRGPLIGLGFICFFVAIAEGVITDWSSVYMRDQLSASESEAPLAYAAFSAIMLIIRLRADRLKDRYGARFIVISGALVAAFGIGMVVVSGDLVITVLGFAIAGAGLAAVFPFVFSAASRRGANALAGVATMGYSGILVGPPVIGMAAHSLGLQAAFLLLGLIIGLIAIVAARMSSFD